MLLLALAAAPAAAQVRVEDFTVTGYSRLSDQAVAAVVGPYARSGLAQPAAEALAAALRSAGAFAAKVYVEPLADGRVELRVLEGRFSADGVVLKQSNPRVDDGVLTRLLTDVLKPGSTLDSARTERAILLSNDLPGMAGSSSTIVPADAVGEARLEFVPVAAAPLSGNAFYDDFGSPYTGRHRVGGALELNSPLRQGDKWSLSANVSDLGTVYADAEASLPLLLPGLRGGVEFSMLDYKTEESSGLRGTSRGVAAYLHYALIRSRFTNVYLDLRGERTAMKDVTRASPVSERLLHVGSLSLAGDHADNLWGGGSTRLQLTGFTGQLDLGGYVPYQDQDAQTARTAGRFSRLTWTLSRLQHLGGPWQSSVETSGQLASKKLDASQSISYGGPMDFPGYNAGEVVGDKGLKLHIDLRHNNFQAHRQWSVFYDAGRVKSHAAKVVGGFVVPGIDTAWYSMHSVGIGFSQKWQNWQLQAALAAPVNNEVPDELLSGGGHARGWLRLDYRF